MAYVCQFQDCKKSETDMYLVNKCLHCFCPSCVNVHKRVEIGGKCAGVYPSKRKCTNVVTNFIHISTNTGGIDDVLKNFKDDVDRQISDVEEEKNLLKNVKDGIVSFTKNLINTSSQLIEKNVRSLQSDQQEKIAILKDGKAVVDQSFQRINEIVDRAQKIKKGLVVKNPKEIQQLQYEVVNFPDQGEYLVNERDYDFPQYPTTDKGLITLEPTKYGAFAVAVSKEKGIKGDQPSFFPPSYLASHYLTTHLVPPYMEYVFVIPNFLKSAKFNEPVFSPYFQTLPFNFSWRFAVFPLGVEAVGRERQLVSVFIELMGGNQVKLGGQFRNLFPEYNQGPFPDFTLPQSSSSSSSTAAAAAASPASSGIPDPALLSADSVAALMRNPFVFDYKIQLIAQQPKADVGKRIYSYESTANFEKSSVEGMLKRQGMAVGKADFISQKEVQTGGFEWVQVGDEKFNNTKSVHFVFGIRFPSFKREYEALRVAHSIKQSTPR